jgi:hypothetical protein
MKNLQRFLHTITTPQPFLFSFYILFPYRRVDFVRTQK